MGRSTDVAAVNSHQGAVVDYGVDPRGWGMAAALAGAHARTLNHQRAVIDTSHSTHHGWTRPLQRLRGLAPLILGSGRPVTPRTGVLGDERSTGPGGTDNAAERILAARWQRQAGGPDW